MENLPERQSPSKFDRAIGALHGLPGVIKTAPTTVRAIMPIVGDAQTFIVQTFRQRDEGDGTSKTTLFLEYVDEAGTVRIVIPPNVLRVILRQSDAISSRSRSLAGKAAAADLKARGIKPGFMRKAKHK